MSPPLLLLLPGDLTGNVVAPPAPPHPPHNTKYTPLPGYSVVRGLNGECCSTPPPPNNTEYTPLPGYSPVA